MEHPSETVQIFGVREQKGRKSPHQVRWEVAGRDKAKSFRTKTAAERYQRTLWSAKDGGVKWDGDTGEPILPGTSPVTVYELAASMVVSKKALEETSRHSLVEALAGIVPVLVRPKAKPAPPEVRRWLVEHLADDPPPKPHPWLMKFSPPIALLTLSDVERAIGALRTTTKGERSAHNYLARRATVLRSLFNRAVRDGIIAVDANPCVRLERIDASLTQGVEAIRPDDYPSVAEVMGLIGTVKGKRADHWVAFWTLVVLAGMRPSEVVHLKVKDLTLPETGRGSAILRGATVSVNGRLVDKQLKWRKPGETRKVPLNRGALDALTTHLDTYGTQPDGRVFRTGPASPWRQAWVRLVEREAAPEGSLADTTVYSLRHVAISAWLDAGISPKVVADWAGNSVAVIHAVYTHVISGAEDRALALFDKIEDC